MSSVEQSAACPADEQKTQDLGQLLDLIENAADKQSKCKGVSWLRKPAGHVDKVMRPRLTQFVTAPWTYVIAAIALVIGVAQPFMELVPFSANGAGAALTAFMLALIARDGLVALVAMALAALTGGIVTFALLA